MFGIEFGIGVKGVLRQTRVGRIGVFEIGVGFQVEHLFVAQAELRLCGSVDLVEGVVVPEAVSVLVKHLHIRRDPSAAQSPQLGKRAVVTIAPYGELIDHSLGTVGSPRRIIDDAPHSLRTEADG